MEIWYDRRIVEDLKQQLTAEVQLDEQRPAKAKGSGSNPEGGLNIALSFNGRTPGSEPGYQGSNPCGAVVVPMEYSLTGKALGCYPRLNIGSKPIAPAKLPK